MGIQILNQDELKQIQSILGQLNTLKYNEDSWNFFGTGLINGREFSHLGDPDNFPFLNDQPDAIFAIGYCGNHPQAGLFVSLILYKEDDMYYVAEIWDDGLVTGPNRDESSKPIGLSNLRSEIYMFQDCANVWE